MAFLKEYENLGELGKVGGGSFAQVYKVRHLELGYVRAIRVLKDLIADENSKQYKDFINECKFLLRLGNSGHPNIVRIYQPRLIDNKAFWEMDYIEGCPVDSFIEKNNYFVPIEEVNRFLLDISSALEYCHVDNYLFSLSRDEDHNLIEIDPNDGEKLIISEENRQKLIKKYCVIHNDIKSNNVMRKFDGSYILLDFGLSFGKDKTVSRSSFMNNGGVEYKAPEKWDKNAEEMTERTDIYSFGIMLYEMLAGRVPFPYNSNFSEGRAIYEVSEHHKNTIPPPIEPLRKAAYEAANQGKTYTKDYPDWLEKVIMKCLEKKPQKRYANGKELYEEVKTLIERENKPKVVEKIVERIVEKPVEVVKTVEVEKIVIKKVTKPLWVVLSVLFFVTTVFFGGLSYILDTKNTGYKTEIYNLKTECENLQLQINDKREEPKIKTKDDEGRIINGVKWATRNVGTTAGTFADKPEDYGGLYTWEEAKTACPKGWRLPTERELQSLVGAGSNWTTQNGVSGREFGNGKLFLPAAGYRSYSDGTLSNQGNNGYYWSSTPIGSECARSLYFLSGNASAYYFYRSYGFSVRCVSE